MEGGREEGRKLKTPSFLYITSLLFASSFFSLAPSLPPSLPLSLSVVALIPLCENMPSGSAFKPGDVVTAMNGKTIEVCVSTVEYL